MRPIFSTSLMALIVAVGLAACSGSSNNAATDQTASVASSDNSTSTDNSASSNAASSDNAASTDNSSMSSDNSAMSSAPAAAGAAAPLYPGATETALPKEAGEAPPGGKSYATSDAEPKVKAWYQANVKTASLKGSTPTGAEFLVGDAKTGTVILLEGKDGKTWILTGPASVLLH